MRTGRILLAGGAAIAVFATSGVAWAYWTSSGSGSGSADVVGTASRLTLHATTSGQLVPGASVPITLAADNPSPTALEVATVHLTGIVADPDHSGCAVADFSMADAVVDQVVPPRAKRFPLTASATLTYANTAVDQSACKGATLSLTITSD